jgi:hypothetical protein
MKLFCDRLIVLPFDTGGRENDEAAGEGLPALGRGEEGDFSGIPQ